MPNRHCHSLRLFSPEPSVYCSGAGVWKIPSDMLLSNHSRASDISVSFSDVTQVGKLYRFATLTKDFKVYKSEVIVLYDKNFL